MDKKVSDSYTEQVQLLTTGNMNGYGRLFGGKLMEWIDVVAAIVARRHSEKNVTTVVVDTLWFKEAAYANQCLLLTGKITYVGKTSMEICVKTYVESLSGAKMLINEAYIVMVALDENDRPTPVPGLILESDEEREEWHRGEQRYNLRKKRKEENY